MAFLRFNRDKRGYEHFYLVEPTSNRRGKVKPRVLYWFRTPPGVRVGREPFDESVRRALEAQNPGVAFDWPAIVETPIPSADADKWRERRRADRAAKQAVASAESGDDDRPSSENGADIGSELETPAEAAPDSPELAAAEAGESGELQNVDEAARRRRRRRRARRTVDSPADGSIDLSTTTASDAAEPPGEDEQSDD